MLGQINETRTDDKKKAMNWESLPQQILEYRAAKKH